jgi:hypothetical protein
MAKWANTVKGGVPSPPTNGNDPIIDAEFFNKEAINDTAY